MLVLFLPFVLPAHAGVIPITVDVDGMDGGITRTCGGDPDVTVFFNFNGTYYPHMRG